MNSSPEWLEDAAGFAEFVRQTAAYWAVNEAGSDYQTAAAYGDHMANLHRDGAVLAQMWHTVEYPAFLATRQPEAARAGSPVSARIGAGWPEPGTPVPEPGPGTWTGTPAWCDFQAPDGRSLPAADLTGAAPAGDHASGHAQGQRAQEREAGQ